MVFNIGMKMKKVFLALAATCLFHSLAASCAFAEGAVAEPVAAVVLPPGYYPVEYVDVTNGAVLSRVPSRTLSHYLFLSQKGLT